MKKLRNKIVAFALICVAVLSMLALTACTNPNPDPGTNPPTAEAETIAILYENDVHCAIDGYSKLASMKSELKGSYNHVGVVSSGDFVQGGTIGAVSKGEYIIDLMNEVGYDAIALGNHEFDYRLDRLIELNEMSNTKFTSCNFAKIGENKPYFDSYTLVSYGDIEIAYIGVITPDTIHSSDPASFKNENGEIVYTFNESTLYATVQATIDSAEAAGADYIIALSHVGYSETGELEDITDLIENTDGFDAVLDAHSHTVIEGMTVKDKSGDDVLLTSTGTKFEYIGKLTITEDGINSELVETATYEKTDADVDACIKEINDSYAELGNRVIGESLVTLNTHDGDVRLVRNSETALGNLCSDALRAVTGSDIAFVNGGGLRAPIEAGEVTFNDIFSVFPYNNQVVTVEVTGKLLLDMLEMGVMKYPEEAGCFPNMSGVKFSINTAIPSSVKTDENGFFVSVEGDYRVYGVWVLDKESGEYKALDLDKTYVLAGFNFHLISGGDGLSMFADAKLIDAEGSLDIEVFETYITQHLNGVIGEEYSEPQGRITFTEGYVTAE